MRFSYSRVECFNKCPYQFKLRYLDKLECLPNTDDAANALFIGSGMHKAIETNTKEGISEYFAKYPIISDLHINEAMKIEFLAPKVQALLAGKLISSEYKLECEDFIGFIDCLVTFDDGTYGIYDYKYSNNVENYLASGQLHVYKYYFEQLTGHKVSKLGYIFIPKTQIRQKKTETLAQFRERLNNTLSGLEIKTVEVEYDANKVFDFLKTRVEIVNKAEFQKNESRLCDWCDYQLFCTKGFDFMILPQNVRRDVHVADRKKLWIYGAPFSGKTTLADQFPNAVMLNTDGNLNSFTSPVIEIKDTYEGRIPVKAWDIFKDAIDTLAKGNHSFQTVVVDLIEDCYEHCRRWSYEKLGIEHESDNSFKAWDFVRNEFLATVKKLMTLPYNVVIISHEDLSKDITKKTGDKITSIRPNIQDKIANKLAGMVDIVGRVVADGDARILNFKSDDVIFGGGRLKLQTTSIACNYSTLDAVYGAQIPAKVVEAPKVVVDLTKSAEAPKVEAPVSPVAPTAAAVVETPKAPKPELPPLGSMIVESDASETNEEQPTELPRRRRRRTAE